jgi:trehalose-6-phosphate synthase
VNPWNTEELAQAIHDAVVMPDELREANHRRKLEIFSIDFPH